MISFKRSFQDFLRQRLRGLGLPIRAVRPPVKTLSFQSAVELFQENPESGALPRGNYRSAAGGCPFRTAPHEFAQLGPVEFHAPPPPPPVKTRDEQVAREMQEREISKAAAAAHDKAKAASSRFAPASPPRRCD